MFVLVQELFGDFNLRKQRCLVQILHGTRLFMFPCLLQIDAGAGAIERHFALLTATLRADTSMDGGTKALFFSLFADRATHEDWLLKSLSHAKSIFFGRPDSPADRGQGG